MRSFVEILLFWTIVGGSPNSHAAWDAQSEKAFVELMCASDSYFRKCFDLAAEKCRSDLKKSVRQCQTSLAVESGEHRKSTKHKANTTSDRPISEAEDVKLHSRIGLCAGLKVEKNWSDRKSAANECRKRENWQ